MAMIYLDNSATTALSEISIERLKEGYEKFGNPSSLHSAGLEAEKLIRCARGELLSALGIRDSSEYTAIFTSSGTESDNLAILGTLRAKNFRFTPRIITRPGESSQPRDQSQFVPQANSLPSEPPGMTPNVKHGLFL